MLSRLLWGIFGLELTDAEGDLEGARDGGRGIFAANATTSCNVGEGRSYTLVAVLFARPVFMLATLLPSRECLLDVPACLSL